MMRCTMGLCFFAARPIFRTEFESSPKRCRLCPGSLKSSGPAVHSGKHKERPNFFLENPGPKVPNFFLTDRNQKSVKNLKMTTKLKRSEVYCVKAVDRRVRLCVQSGTCSMDGRPFVEQEVPTGEQAYVFAHTNAEIKDDNPSESYC